jgi:hypothetical protein
MRIQGGAAVGGEEEQSWSWSEHAMPCRARHLEMCAQFVRAGDDLVPKACRNWNMKWRKQPGRA